MFIISRLDYCNSLYYGTQNKIVDRLQMVQNTAARMLTGICTIDHITLVLTSLLYSLPLYIRDLPTFGQFKSIN